MACGPLTKKKKRKKEIKQKFKETGDIRYIFQNEFDKPVFNMIWLIVCTKMYQQERSGKKIYRLLTKYCTIRRLELLFIHDMMDINEELRQWSTNFLIKNLKALLLTEEHELILRINN